MKGLEGIKVIELCGYVAAPACPRILGEMGATIYKVEPFSGDEYRTNAPGFGMKKTDIDDPAFDLASMNKEWLSINLKNDEGKAFVYKMLETADVLVTSFRDKALKTLRASMPRPIPHAAVYLQAFRKRASIMRRATYLQRSETGTPPLH